LVMGTRSGDIDPSLLAFLSDNLGIDVHKATSMLNKESGLLGISELASDMRTLEEAAEQGNKQALLAEDIFCYRLAKYIASYTVPLSRIDALVFTGGIGENSVRVREKTLTLLKALHFNVDKNHNANHGKENNGIISQPNSTTAIVIPTNEEWVIAQDAAALANSRS
jgi:acetate kinase